MAAKFGFDVAPLRELVDWAEIIDGALFPDAKMAVELKEPALQLMTFIENNRDPALADRFIGDLISRPLADIAADDYVVEALGPLLAQHHANIDVIRAAAKLEGGVVFFDVADQDIGAFNKFITYYLFPEARYSVGLTRRRAPRSRSARTPGPRSRARTTSARSASATAAAATRWSARCRCRAISWRGRGRSPRRSSRSCSVGEARATPGSEPSDGFRPSRDDSLGDAQAPAPESATAGPSAAAAARTGRGRLRLGGRRRRRA